MKAFWRRYLNEIVGLTIMVVMTIALIDGQAHALGEKHATGPEHKMIEVRLTIGK
jgi:hypothetical protein